MEFFGLTKIPVYALDLSDQSFKFLRLIGSGREVVVGSFGEGAIDKGVLESGEIKDKNRLSVILKDIFSKNQIKFVALSLPEEKGFLREIRISGVSEGELFSALEFQIEEHIPLKAKDIYFDHVVIGKGADYFDLVVNAFPKDIVDSYLDTISSSGALPVLVESELESAARAVVPKGFAKSVMVVDWGKTRASFSIFEKEVLKFASTVLVGGERLDYSISKNLGIGKNEALKIKFEMDISDSKSPGGVLNAVISVVSELALEIRKILDYWGERGETKNNIEQIFLSGGDSNLFGLPEYLERELGIPVSLANPWINVNFPPKYLPEIKFKDSLRFSSAIGLGLKAMNKEKVI